LTLGVLATAEEFLGLGQEERVEGAGTKGVHFFRDGSGQLFEVIGCQ
jgi:hypothetical protein